MFLNIRISILRLGILLTLINACNAQNSQECIGLTHETGTKSIIVVRFVNEVGEEMKDYHVTSIISSAGKEFVSRWRAVCVAGLESGEYTFTVERSGNDGVRRQRIRVPVYVPAKSTGIVVPLIETPPAMVEYSGAPPRVCGKINKLSSMSQLHWVELLSALPRNNVSSGSHALVDARGRFCIESRFEEGLYHVVVVRNGSPIFVDGFQFLWNRPEDRINPVAAPIVRGLSSPGVVVEWTVEWR